MVHEARPDNSQRWVPPTHCPSCSSPLVSLKPGYSSQPGQLFCVGRACPEQSTARLRYFCSKMDIRGLGPRTVDLLLGLKPELELHHLYGLTQVGGGLCYGYDAMAVGAVVRAPGADAAVHQAHLLPRVIRTVRTLLMYHMSWQGNYVRADMSQHAMVGQVSLLVV